MTTKDKVIFALIIVVIGLLVTVTLASAQGIQSCGDNHAVYSADNQKIVNCIAKADWEKSQAEAAQRRADDLGGNLKVIPQGQNFWDIRGFENGCEWWYPMHCVVKPEWFVSWL